VRPKSDVPITGFICKKARIITLTDRAHASTNRVGSIYIIVASCARRRSSCIPACSFDAAALSAAPSREVGSFSRPIIAQFQLQIIGCRIAAPGPPGHISTRSIISSVDDFLAPTLEKKSPCKFIRMHTTARFQREHSEVQLYRKTGWVLSLSVVVYNLMCQSVKKLLQKTIINNRSVNCCCIKARLTCAGSGPEKYREYCHHGARSGQCVDLAGRLLATAVNPEGCGGGSGGSPSTSNLSCSGKPYPSQSSCVGFVDFPPFTSSSTCCFCDSENICATNCL
jgi:hypothetical protein